MGSDKMYKWLTGDEIRVDVVWEDIGKLVGCPKGERTAVACMGCSRFGGFRNGTVDGLILNTPIEVKGMKRRVAEQVVCVKEEEECV